MITIDLYAAEYAPWEDEADKREKIGEHSESLTFDNARECADWLEREGFGSPSVDPGPYDRRTWLSELDPYEHPYTGVLTERSVHLAIDPEFNPRVWAAIVASVTRRWTRYAGPYYVERVNCFGVRL